MPFVDQRIKKWIAAYLLNCQAQQLSPHSISFYTKRLSVFADYCESQGVVGIHQLTAQLLREYIVHLTETHNPGGVDGYFRVMRSFLKWYEWETDEDTPIRKVKHLYHDPPLRDPVPLEVVQALLKVSYTARDTALILFLYDTGIRDREVRNVLRTQYDELNGEINLSVTKNKQKRIVRVGPVTRKAMRKYLQGRTDKCDALFVTDEGDYLAQYTIHSIIKRLSKRAGVKVYNPHSYRSAFALNCLRNGINVYALQDMMGHKDLQVMLRYLKLTEKEIRLAGMTYSPTDDLKR